MQNKQNGFSGIIIAIIVAVILIGAVVYYSGANKSEENVSVQNTKSQSETVTPTNNLTSVGSYEEYAPSKLARAENGKVVLFFRALWCPTCVGLDNDIKAHLKDIPKDVTVLYVDYDNSSALKQKYLVTIQHTLVQVDKDGNLIKKWRGSPTLDSLVAEIQ